MACIFWVLCVVFLKRTFSQCTHPLSTGVTWNFETGDLAGWTKSGGTAFDCQPTLLDNPTARNRGQPALQEQQWWIGTNECYQGLPSQTPGEVGGNQRTGQIQSDDFCIDGVEISFLIGGGNSERRTYIALVIDNVEVMKETGDNHESMRRKHWDVRNFIGATAAIRIVDERSGSGWGHINVDDIQFVDSDWMSTLSWEPSSVSLIKTDSGVDINVITPDVCTWVNMDPSSCPICGMEALVTSTGHGIAGFSFEAPTVPQAFFIGLTSQESCADASFRMTYGLGLDRDRLIYIFEFLQSATDDFNVAPGGANRVLDRLYQPGDVISIAVENNCVVYRINGDFLYRSLVKVETPLWFDFSFGGTLYGHEPVLTGLQYVYFHEHDHLCTPPQDVLTTWDFDTGDLTGWHTSGDALELLEVLDGNFMLHTSDSNKGLMTSAIFCITEVRISFMVGGGRHPMTDKHGPCVVALEIYNGGQSSQVLSATGQNDDILRRVEWDVSAYLGKKARIIIIDHNTNPDIGHINADDFSFYGTCGVQAKEGCSSITNRQKCLSTSDGRMSSFYDPITNTQASILGQPCVWCQDSECYSLGNVAAPKCEARNYFLAQDSHVSTFVVASCHENAISFVPNYCYETTVNSIKPLTDDWSCSLCGSEPLVTSLEQGVAGFSFTVTDMDIHVAIGLSHGPDCGRGDWQMTYALKLRGGWSTCPSCTTIYEQGDRGAWDNRGPNYGIGDEFSVLVEGGRVCYRRNGDLIYCSNLEVELPLYFDMSTFTVGTKLTNVKTISHKVANANCIPPEEIGVSWDFEKGNLEGWTLIEIGTAFSTQPTFGDNPTARNRGQISNHQGNWWIGGYEDFRNEVGQIAGSTQNDEPVGAIISKPFCIAQNRITFLIGGGNHPNHCYVALVVDGEEVLTATGKDTEIMRPVIWDVNEYLGKTAQIKIVDRHSGRWGHINVDLFQFSGQCPEGTSGNNGGCYQNPDKETCLSHSDARNNAVFGGVNVKGQNCIWIRRRSNDQGWCGTMSWFTDNNIDEDDTRFHHYEVASCEAADYRGPLEVSPWEVVLSETDAYAPTIIIGFNSLLPEDVSVTCCLDFSGMEQEDGSIPIGSETCCVGLDSASPERSVKISAKENKLQSDFWGRLGVYCHSDHPDFCGLSKDIIVTGKPNIPPPGRGARCSGTGDPHYNDWQGVRFDFQSIGNFWFVRHKDDEWNVQTTLKTCSPWGKRVMCGEKVAVSFRNERIAFVIPKDTQSLKQVLFGKDYQYLIIKEQNQNLFTVSVTNGAVVKIKFNKHPRKPFAYLNVYAESSKDYSQSIRSDCICGCVDLAACPNPWDKNDREVVVVADGESLFLNAPNWSPPDPTAPVEGKRKLIHTCQDCGNAVANLQSRECEVPCCDCQVDPECVLNGPECCDYVCPEDDHCCKYPEDCPICDDPNGCLPDCCDHDDPDCNEEDYCCWDCLHRPNDPAPDGMDCCCYDCRIPGFILGFGQKCCDPCYECGQNEDSGPNGEPCCCEWEECCADECDWVFDTYWVREASEKCDCVERDILFLRKQCLLDSSILGCDWVNQTFADTIECIIKEIIYDCDCPPPPPCPLSCDVMGNHSQKIITEDECYCICDPGYFGVQCDHNEDPVCNVIGGFGSPSDVLRVDGSGFYSGDSLSCVFSSSFSGVVEKFSSPAQVAQESETCLNIYGTGICTYGWLYCRLPPAGWAGYHIEKIWKTSEEISLYISSDLVKVSTSPSCQITVHHDCYSSFVGGLECLTGWLVNMENINSTSPSHSVCCRQEVCQDWIMVNDCDAGFHVDETTLSAVNPSHDVCCHTTPAPTNAPTWPPHLFVPEIVPITPWFNSYTNRPTQPPVAYPTPAPNPITYVPAKPGTIALPYCLGFGSQCDPVYTNY